MANIIISPGKYVQGKGELSNLGSYVKKLGKKMLVLTSASGFKRVGAIVETSLKACDCEAVFEVFNGECSKNEINRLVALVEKNDCDMVIGVGGGKILDTSKAVAYTKKIPVAICPTIASTDAPCSALSVIYSDDGVFEEYLFLTSNPNIVLVDTDIVSAAPARLLVSGMGDALATYFEAKAASDSLSDSCAGGKATMAALALARLCYDTLIAEGLKAKLALEAGVCTPAVEKIIEANTYLSGIGFESGGLAGAHAIHNGLTLIKECHHLYHGEKVAFGTLTQLVLTDEPKELLDEVIGFCMSVGLPTTLKALGIDNPKKEELMEVAKLAASPNDTLGNLPIEVTPEKVYAAIMGADALGRYYEEHK